MGIHRKKTKSDVKKRVRFRRRPLIFLFISAALGIIIIASLGMYYWPLTLAAALVIHFILVDRQIDEIDFWERYKLQTDFPYLAAGVVIVAAMGILVGNLAILNLDSIAGGLFFIGLALVIWSSNPRKQPKESKIKRYVIYPLAIIVTLALLFGF